MLRKKDEPQQKTKKQLFGRGFEEVTQRVEKSNKFFMSCFNCEHFYQGVGDEQEVCQNTNVLKWDVIVEEGGRVYCHLWELCRKTDTAKSLFKRGVRR